MIDLDLPILAGILGMMCILTGFFLVQTHKWNPDQLRYDVLNLIGSLLLCYYGYIGQVWPFVVLNAVWALVSFKDVVTDIRDRKIEQKS